MSNLAALTTQRDGLLKKIREIEGSGNDVEKILEAIKNQRWYFIKNKPKILFDKSTGLLWANLHTFNCCKEGGKYYSPGEADNIISGYSFGMDGFRVPTCYELWQAVADKTIPFHEDHYGGTLMGRVRMESWRLLAIQYWTCEYNGYKRKKDLDEKGATRGLIDNELIPAAIFPCSDYLIQNSDYQEKVNPDNPVYTEKERLQFTLDLFTKNELLPVFNDEAITELYKKLYFEKPQLVEQLQELENQIKQLQTVTLLSSEFDHTALLAKYDIKAINVSLIKYYQAVQQWCRELMEKVDYYEEQKASVIKDFNLISLKLSKKYEANSNLTEAENILLRDRQHFFQKNFSLGMSSVKTKLLAVKKQADALEYKIDEINDGDNSLRELAELEQEKRVSFAFLAENTAQIIKNALLKIEYFEVNNTFVKNAINIWENWSEGYRVFKTTYKEDMKHDCEDDGIEEEIWSAWYQDWQQLRYAIELKMQPVIERGLRGDMPTNKEVKTSVPEQLIHILDEYKKQIDKFYKEERKGIYQKFAFQAGGNLQEKFETESSLYKFVAMLQSELQDIIFNCKNAEDRVWILNWANSLLDIQIDEVLKFVANNDLQKISHTILDEFAGLKQKNYDIYLADAKAYSVEKARREKAYNSLIFKMRKDLAK
ncbi:hypothetical protein [Phascolarctobacterium sp.]|uniref:hypothetical protein n=1 Tax=Phascolarctobacterium sp. TaxID=2049039 RepID=UPI002A81FD15|nr:hypothetical protein [Phascolarctobacterium sp.]MDY5044497.1 hypothetical protein [Phascolarctobacterium sp.]